MEDKVRQEIEKLLKKEQKRLENKEKQDEEEDKRLQFFQVCEQQVIHLLAMVV